MFDDDLRPYTGILHAPEVVREWLKDMKLPPLLEPQTIERTAWNGPEQHGEVGKLVERKRKKRRHDRGSIEYTEREQRRRQECERVQEQERSTARKVEVEHVRRKFRLGYVNEGKKMDVFALRLEEEEESAIEHSGGQNNWNGIVPRLIRTLPTPPVDDTSDVQVVHCEDSGYFNQTTTAPRVVASCGKGSTTEQAPHMQQLIPVADDDPTQRSQFDVLTHGIGGIQKDPNRKLLEFTLLGTHVERYSEAKKFVVPYHEVDSWEVRLSPLPGNALRYRDN